MTASPLSFACSSVPLASCPALSARLLLKLVLEMLTSMDASVLAFVWYVDLGLLYPELRSRLFAIRNRTQQRILKTSLQ